MSEQATHEVSRAEFARIVGVSRAAVTIAANNDRFTGEALGTGKKLRLPAALQQWNANSDQRGLGLREPDGDLDDDDETETAPSASPAVPGSVAYEKQRAYRLRADKLELENAQARGELIARDRVTRGLQEAGVKIGADIDAIAGWAEKLAAVATGDVAAMRAALRENCRQLRTDIADRLDGAIESKADEDDDADD